MKKPKRVLYENTTLAQEKWLKDMQKLLDKMPKDFYLNADGYLHVFSKFTDGTMFTPCKDNEAYAALITTFKNVTCDGGDFW